MSAFILPGNPVKLQQSSDEHQQPSDEHQQPSDEHQQLSDDHQQPSAEHQQQSGECKPSPVVDSKNSGNATATQLYCCITLLFVCIHMEVLFQGQRKHFLYVPSLQKGLTHASNFGL